MIVNQEFTMKNIEKIKNCFIKETDQNKLMSNKHKKVCASLNYIEHFLILVSAENTCISIYVVVSLFVILIGITNSATELKIYAITAGIKKYQSIIKKKKKKHDK